ncbi:VOC family protein [Polymorphospora rubra]|uniref:Ring-cleaving dioxygenase n=1 Tax=Polymorphospora rubra TaxID=338584 RepID=A0A810MSI1_9ACTN|nr:VOC family protein [Polymorphospora rubra]BCJ63614.1 ring-cleaving dioxygenase [Polymorphospora rubra]
MIEIERVDHLVLTVADVDRTVDFYRRVLGMRPVVFGTDRRALAFGNQKINLHQAGRKIAPAAHRPTPGSADLCLVSRGPLADVLTHLAACRVPVEAGPVDRTGAVGPMVSVYLRDPDHNLIEVCSYSGTTAPH